jgi:hypothetical protein
MTDAATPNPAPDAPQKGAQEGAREPRGIAFDTSELLPDMVAYGRELLDRVSDRAAEMGPKIREKGYDADQWVDDIKWFWENVMNDAVRAAKYWQQRFPTA